MSWKRTTGVVAAALGAAVGTLFVGATTAAAFGPSYCNSSTCSLSNSPSTGGFYFEMPRNTPVTMICWTDAQWWNGTNRWFKVGTGYGQGYMIATQVSNQTSVGHC
ncbi:hypothetical protein [Streptomyces sp. AK04-3B]|uniref:hypothetical protein n=1 Tax=unclassified Streptomyces TaxID=2593676 RepID=UPI0029BC63CD|nr:hypothetical protein [Streptomyces sp. AK04-3B]MDX3798579.1 hypothetical protein [Streptomyces sp. AK04-3B]